MGGVNLDHTEARLAGASRRLGKGGDGVADAVRRQGRRHRVVAGKCDGAGRHDVGPAAVRHGNGAIPAPRPAGAGLAAGVRQLDAGDAAVFVDEPDDPRQRLDVVVGPDAEVLRADAALGGHRRGFRHHQAGAAHRAAAEMHEMPVVGEPVDARVLAHRRHEDAIGEGHGADRQRIEQVWHGCGSSSRPIAVRLPAARLQGWLGDAMTRHFAPNPSSAPGCRACSARSRRGRGRCYARPRRSGPAQGDAKHIEHVVAQVTAGLRVEQNARPDHGSNYSASQILVPPRRERTRRGALVCGDARPTSLAVEGRLVDQTRASWNRSEAWLRRLDGLRRVSRPSLRATTSPRRRASSSHDLAAPHHAHDPWLTVWGSSESEPVRVSRRCALACALSPACAARRRPRRF